MNAKIQVELQEWMGSDLAVANAAWTSTYDKTKREAQYDDPEKLMKLISRMAIEGHSTPFESVVFRFWLRIPIFTDRQHMTHRIASHNGLSGRYRTVPDDWFSIPLDCREILDRAVFGGSESVANFYDSVCNTANEAYRGWLENLKKSEEAGKITNAEYKRVREILRGVIPVASMVERTTLMNLRSFANYQRLRNSDHAQPEIRQVAQMMLALVEEKQICPLALNALRLNGWRI